MSLLLTCDILGLLLNTLTVNDKYLLHYADNVPETIQMHLFKKYKSFS